MSIDFPSNLVSVLSKMSRLVHRFAFHLYNFSSILCLKLENRVCEVSNLAAFVNILKIPFMVLFSFIIATNPVLRDTITLESLVVLKDYSTFSRVSIIIAAVQLYLITFIFCVAQSVRRYKVRNFMRNFMEKALDEKYFMKYKSYCFKHSLAFTILILIILVVSFFGSFKRSIWSFFALMVYSYPFVLLTTFTSFVSNFENFVIASLKQFRKDLKQHHSLHVSLTREQNFEIYLELSRKYREIYGLTMQFNDCFGPLITLACIHMISTMIFGVGYSHTFCVDS